jgi:hypothetical protein
MDVKRLSPQAELPVMGVGIGGNPLVRNVAKTWNVLLTGILTG